MSVQAGLTPSSREEAVALLRESRGVRIVGGGTKLAWGRPCEAELELSTAGLDELREHNEGDLTAVLEAGVPLARAQEAFGRAGQMLSLDPPLGEGERATIGGVLAAADSGPLRHRYGAARDLAVGVTVALSDGTVAKAGGKVIKNVAGYDLMKLFAGSFGTLGLVLEVAIRLHPRPERTATAIGTAADPAALAAAASAAAHARIELQSLDVRWSAHGGAVLARTGGAAPRVLAEDAAAVLRDAGLEAELVDDDAELWEAQRAGQRSASGTVVRVSALQTGLEAVLRTARRLGAAAVGRAALGISWLRLEDRSAEEAAGAVEELRRDLSTCVVLDAPAAVRERVDPWGPMDGPAREVMRRVKERFDPAGTCNPGVLP
jgi:glycolate dehydrogenase FAD-binding subunit